MKKYYLSKIKQFTDPGLGTYWGHALQAHPNIDYVGGEIKTDATGTPTETALLVLVGARDHATIKADPDILEVPAGQDSLNTQIGATDTPTKLQFRARLLAMGHGQADVDAVTDNIRSWRKFVNDMGQRNNHGFNVDNFDLNEA